jgi:hypothetical protein
MAQTPVTNFGKVTVSIGYDAAATSIVLSTGHGSRLPSTFPYPLTWWDATTYSDPADDPSREIVIVTNRAGDTLTVTRAGEGTSASTKNTGGKTYKMVEGLTKAMWESLFTNSLSQSFRGLSVQTHPDNDKALSTVRFSADAIVMDDGQEVRSWSNIDVAITASGVNGLDTGSEAASTGYELWAIYNGTTKAGVLHKAKDYFLDETWDQSGGTTEDGQHLLRDATARTKLAQGFKVDTAGLVEFVDVKVAKIGTPTGNFWFTIEATSGGVPSNTPLATSDKYDVSRLTTTSGFIRLPFSTPASLSAATQYHLVLQGDFTVSGTNHMLWRADTTAATYANGSKAAYDGTTWTSDTDDDFLFKIYVTRNDVAVTLPSGYTQKAKICPWVYNNASSNLKHFYQNDHTVFCGYDDDWQIGALTATTPTLIDLFAFLPPLITNLWCQRYNITASYTAMGPLTATDLSSTASDERISSVRSTLAGSYIIVVPRLIVQPYQGLMHISDGGTNNLYVSSFEW